MASTCPDEWLYGEDPFCDPELDLPPVVQTATSKIELPISAQSTDEQLKDVLEISIKQGDSVIQDTVKGYAKMPCVTDECFLKDPAGMQVVFFTENIGRVVLDGHGEIKFPEGSETTHSVLSNAGFEMDSKRRRILAKKRRADHPDEMAAGLTAAVSKVDTVSAYITCH